MHQNISIPVAWGIFYKLKCLWKSSLAPWRCGQVLFCGVKRCCFVIRGLQSSKSLDVSLVWHCSHFGQTVLSKEWGSEGRKRESEVECVFLSAAIPGCPGWSRGYLSILFRALFLHLSLLEQAQSIKYCHWYKYLIWRNSACAVYSASTENLNGKPDKWFISIFGSLTIKFPKIAGHAF